MGGGRKLGMVDGNHPHDVGSLPASPLRCEQPCWDHRPGRVAARQNVDFHYSDRPLTSTAGLVNIASSCSNVSMASCSSTNL